MALDLRILLLVVLTSLGVAHAGPSIQSWETDKGAKVMFVAAPVSLACAIFRTGETWSVFRAVGERVERVPVEIGRRNTGFATVLTGLEAGDRVVEHPSEQLEDGALFVERATF